MKIWIDAQLPPTLALWLTETFDVEATALRELGLRDAKDVEIFEAAQVANAVIMTKDSDFVDLSCRLGIPPQILYNCYLISRIHLKLDLISAEDAQQIINSPMYIK
ncbi:hypothetical protein NIES4072_08640 [Nostoc commune NIES-4072]|uniref:DUF5615 domain-containing protein n=1 Tax=Nostoc commune NIES-4072 TaxID=2005467 RepID=A0A2R5FGG1_NOSCO|nr:DUF5615 family PIN-like protein [Nostoc commune]BBD65461.1 hypothetical protein NIES4070_18190 [Nostoc commune HK-02]GBG17215.1 hypothetical protein NIES4072_08640 [Nostoc commune NIES-4072]